MNIGRANSSILVCTKRPLKVLVILVTLWSFLFNAVYFNQSEAVGETLEHSPDAYNGSGGFGSEKELRVNTFVLPEYLGRVVDSYNGNSGKIVIHIQDAHCNYTAQHTIAQIIGYAADRYGLNIVNLEGGAGNYNLSAFTSIDDTGVRDKVSDYFVKKGMINAGEYFAINYPEKAALWGVEDTQLYIDNLNVYRESLKHKEEIDKDLNVLTNILTNLKNKIYSPALLELDSKYLLYKSGKLDLKDYLHYLGTIAKERMIDIKQFRNIYALSQILEQEGTIDFKEANRQRNSILEMLKNRLSNKEINEIAAKTVEFKSDRISPAGYYAYILKKAKSVGLDMNLFPEFQKYLVYLSMYETIDKTKTIDETVSLELALRETMYSNGKEREIDKLFRNLILIKNIFAIALSKEDYKYYQSDEGAFAMKNYIAFIHKEAPLYKIYAKPDSSIEKVDEYRENMMKFFKYSFERDEVFLKNMKYSGNNTAIIVTGGFHSENLTWLLKKEGVSYISIMPSFKNEEGYQSPYFSILGGVNPLGELGKSVSVQLSGMQVQSYLAENSARILGPENIDTFKAAAIIVQRLFASPDKMLIVTGRDGKNIQYTLTESGEVKIREPDADNIKAAVPISEIIEAAEKIFSGKGQKQPPVIPETKTVAGGTSAGTVAEIVAYNEEGGESILAVETTGGAKFILESGDRSRGVAIIGTGDIAFRTETKSTGQVIIKGPTPAEAGNKANNWNGMGDAIVDLAKSVKEKVRKNIAGEVSNPAMVIVLVKPEEGTPSSIFLEKTTDIRKALEKNARELNNEHVIFKVIVDDENANEKVAKAIAESNITDSNRIVLFGYSNLTEFKEKAYVVYMEGDAGQTVTPVNLCGDTGLAILNYFDLEKKVPNKEERAFDTREAIKLIARGVAHLAGISQDAIEEIAAQIASNGELLRSGLLKIIIRPIIAQDLKDYYERELAVRISA